MTTESKKNRKNELNEFQKKTTEMISNMDGQELFSFIKELTMRASLRIEQIREDSNSEDVPSLILLCSDKTMIKDAGSFQSESSLGVCGNVVTLSYLVKNCMDADENFSSIIRKGVFLNFKESFIKNL